MNQKLVESLSEIITVSHVTGVAKNFDRGHQIGKKIVLNQ